MKYVLSLCIFVLVSIVYMAHVQPVPAQSNTQCLPLGDINCSGKVTIEDLASMLSVFLTNSPREDLDQSGEVNTLDLSILLSNYGKSGQGVTTPTLGITNAPQPTTPLPTSQPSGNEQVVFDDVIQFVASDRGFDVLKPDGQTVPGLPRNWKSPHDYFNGTWHIRWTITQQDQTPIPGRFQICVWDMNAPRWHPENCGPQSPHNGRTNTSYTSQSIPAKLSNQGGWWKKDGDSLDFSDSTPFLIRSVLRGENGCNVTDYNGVANSCAHLFSKFDQMKYRITIVMVPAGAAFSGWDNYH